MMRTNLLSFFYYTMNLYKFKIFFLFLFLSFVSAYYFLVRSPNETNHFLIAFDISLFVFTITGFLYFVRFLFLVHSSKITDGDIELNKIHLNDFDLEMGYKLIKLDIGGIKQYVAHSKEVNYHINQNKLKIKIDKQAGKRINEFIYSNQNILYLFLLKHFCDAQKYKKLFFNEKKLCLSKEIDINNIDIHCHKASYYDTFLTNRAFNKSIYFYESEKLVNLSRLYKDDFFGDYKAFKEIGSNVFCNQIGVSTVAFTKDKYVVIWIQSDRTHSGSGLLVPTGSGSVDWIDIIEDDLTNTIKNAMQRELQEESLGKVCSDYSNAIETHLIGYYKWLDRGAQPQFAGLSKINLEFLELNPNKSEVGVGYYRKVNRLSDLLVFIEELLENKYISLSLFMNLYFLKDICINKPFEIDEIIQFEE